MGNQKGDKVILNMLIIRRVVGDSMLPGLASGAIVVGLKPKKPKTGDVVIITHNGKEKIKRVKSIDEYEMYVVGDNPGKSTDSRHFGPLTKHAVIATIVWPRNAGGT